MHMSTPALPVPCRKVVPPKMSLHTKAGLIKYMTITSYKFVETIPFIREVDKLEYSDFDKMVILMIVIGMDCKEVADILMSDINSIKTIRTRRRKAIDHMRHVLTVLHKTLGVNDI